MNKGSNSQHSHIDWELARGTDDLLSQSYVVTWKTYICWQPHVLLLLNRHSQPNACQQHCATHVMIVIWYDAMSPATTWQCMTMDQATAPMWQLHHAIAPLHVKHCVKHNPKSNSMLNLTHVCKWHTICNIGLNRWFNKTHDYCMMCDLCCRTMQHNVGECTMIVFQFNVTVM